MFIRNKITGNIFYVLEELETDYKIIQTVPFADIGDVQLITYTSKENYDVIDIDKVLTNA